MRKIIHIDMDAFYASVEQRDNPDLKGKPLAVGGSSDRGVVAAASYEARRFGVRSAMPSKIAARKCPDLIFVRPRFDAYKEVSHQIRDIFYNYTDLVEPLSLDEAYLDVTTNKKSLPSATLIAHEIKTRIRQQTHLTASAGISINKFLAKTASDVNKPDGLFVIPPDEAIAYVEKLPIERFFGIGKVTAEKMHKMGIYNGLDLKQLSEPDLVSRFGKAGRYYFRIARAQDEREVNPNRIRKSLGAENTFEQDLTQLEQIREQLLHITEILTGRMEHSNTKGKTLTLKVKFSDFQIITRSKTLTTWIEDEKQIIALFEELLQTLDMNNIKIRLLGLSVSNLNHEMKEEEPPGLQLTLDF
ncbi:DNA polymerase IV [Fulvivirga sp. M361]|uniref:DNA polymerase IV n=1 Tax=Fulvivirga sp. M361 TaxID=2594266 RepID=UPI00117BDA1E|nr:DNA polymerase IV [Fulvivirga sp. M361]TRX59469.1 DNA polymerase IV [Fulvivirga sp. M361]